MFRTDRLQWFCIGGASKSGPSPTLLTSGGVGGTDNGLSTPLRTIGDGGGTADVPPPSPRVVLVSVASKTWPGTDIRYSERRRIPVLCPSADV